MGLKLRTMHLKTDVASQRSSIAITLPSLALNINGIGEQHGWGGLLVDYDYALSFQAGNP